MGCQRAAGTGRSWSMSSVEGKTYDWLFLTLLSVLIVTIFGTSVQVRVTWTSLQGLLNTLNSLPISTAFTRLSDAGKRSPIWVRRLNLKSLDIPLRSSTVLHDICVLNVGELGGNDLQTAANSWVCIYWNAVRNLLEEDKEKHRPAPTSSSKRNLKQWIASILSWPGANLPGKGMTTELISRSDLRRAFYWFWYVSASLAHEICDRMLIPEWRARVLPWKPRPAVSEKGETVAERNVPVTERHDAYNLALSFVALQYAAFIIYAVRQIQNLLWSLSLGFVLLALALSSYNFQSPQMIERSLLVAFLVLGYVAWKCMSQMERDPILSRLAGTTAGELNKEFYFKFSGVWDSPGVGAPRVTISFYFEFPLLVDSAYSGGLARR